MKKALACGTAVLMCMAAPAFAQNTRGNTTSQPSTQAQTKSATSMKADESFVKKAAAGGLAEVEFGKLAQEKASSPEVKNFGQRMVDDHSKANDELKSIAQKKDITLPTTMDAKDKAAYNRLSKLSGPAFDRAYMHDMVNDHKTDVSEFQYEARAGQDADVRSFASKTVPTLEDHLKLAESTNSAVATSGTKGKSSTTGTSGTRGATGATGATGTTTTTPKTGTNPK